MGEVTTSSKDAIRNEADRLNDEAVRLQGQTRFDRAREAFTRAAALYQQIGDKAGEARCLNGVGATSKDLEEFSEARRWLEAALPLRQEVGDRRGEALTLLTLGPVYKALGLSEQAEKVLEIALHLAEKSGDRRLQGQVCFNLGSTNKASGNYEAALKWDEQALAIALELSDQVEAGKCFHALGQSYSGLARFDEAMKHFEAGLALARRLQRHASEAITLEDIGVLHMQLGQPGEARRCIEEAFRILGQETAISLMPNTACLYGLLLLEDYNDVDNARRYLHLALEIAREGGNLRVSAYALQLLARVSMKNGELQESVSLLDESMQLYRKCGDVHGEVGALQTRAALESELGRHEQAKQHAQEALAKASSIGDEWGRATALYNLGVCHDALGEKEPALEFLDRSVTLFDRLRHRVTGDELRTSFFDERTVQTAYYVYVSRLLVQSESTSDKAYAIKAFLVSERRRARALLDWIDKQESDSNRTGEGWFSGSLSLRDFQERLLAPGTLLLEYSLHRGNSYLFAIQDDAFEVHTLPGGKDIQEEVLKVLRLAKSGTASEFEKVSRELYDILLGPVANLLPGKKLLIVPDGVLHYLPFGMLVASALPSGSRLGDRSMSQPDTREDARGFLSMLTQRKPATDWSTLSFLVAENEMAYAPSAAVLSVLARRQDVGKGVDYSLDFMGLAPFDLSGIVFRGQQLSALPRTRDEIEEIGKLFPVGRAILFVGENATKSSVMRRELKRCKYLHFATHGLVNPFEPKDSGLILRGSGSEGVLNAAQIMKLQLTADVVVLSACDSGSGKLRLGEGVIGLARAFLYAGAHRVCASLWEVADTAAAKLMHCYYRNLLQHGMDNMKALHAAQLTLLGSEKYSSPYYWAPFILVGG